MIALTLDQLLLQQHIRAKNAEWVAECEAAGAEWYSTITDDMEYWAELGITTVAQYERSRLESSIWDLYKDVNGVRPRHMDFASMSDAELEAEYDSLLDDLKAVQEREAIEEAEAVAEFEKTIQSIIECGAKDRQTALRWYVGEANTYHGDWGYFCLSVGLPYSLAKEFEEAFSQEAA